MHFVGVLAFGFTFAVLAGCQKNDLLEPPVPLGDFALGLNIVVTDKMQKVPISRDATAAEWEAAVEKAIDDRFGRYQGNKLYNLGISVDAYALAPPGLPIVLSPKSVLAITANVWDDAAQKKLNPEGKQLIIFESLSPETAIGSGLTQSRERQIELLSYNAAKSIEGWLLDHPEWLDLPPKPASPAAPSTTMPSPTAPVAAAVTAPAVAPASAGVAVPIRPKAKPLNPNLP